MIERDPSIPDNIIELDRHNSFGDYGRAYGDELARQYEDLNLIVFPFFPLEIDLELIQKIKFPQEAPKIGTANGLADRLIERDGAAFTVKEDHFLLKGLKKMTLASYLQSEIASVNAQIKEALRILFPKYYSMHELNMTWRFTDTEDEGMHFDVFAGGVRVDPNRRKHRLKFFINLDSEPRRWETSVTLPVALKSFRDRLPDELPAGINQINPVVNECGGLADAASHKLSYPTLAAVFGNAEVLSHSVRYGRRMIAGEFSVEVNDMLDPGKCTHALVPKWLEEAGIKATAG